MRALFKQENPNILIIRDADWNEASLLMRYLDNIKNGASLDAKAAYNGNQEVNGIVFTITEKEPVPETDSYIKVKATITNDSLNLPVFRIQLASESENYNAFKINQDKWTDLKLVLSALGVADLSITPKGDIVGANRSGVVVEGTVVIPKGLIQYVDVVTSTTNNFSDALTITLGEKSIDQQTSEPDRCPVCGKPIADSDEEDSTQDSELKCQCAKFND